MAPCSFRFVWMDDLYSIRVEAEGLASCARHVEHARVGSNCIATGAKPHQ